VISRKKKSVELRGSWTESVVTCSAVDSALRKSAAASPSRPLCAASFSLTGLLMSFGLTVNQIAVRPNATIMDWIFFRIDKRLSFDSGCRLP
jgi:hypothetical protein